MTRLVGRPLNWAITATAGAGFLLFGMSTKRQMNPCVKNSVLRSEQPGYDQGVMSGLLTGNAFTNQFPEIDTTDGGNGSPSLQGITVAIYDIGCFMGAILMFFVGEFLGRRRSILIGCSIMIVGAILQAAAYGIPQVSVVRT